MTKPKRIRTHTPEQKARRYAYMKVWNVANRHERRLRTYGITSDQYDALLSAQDFKCAICSTDSPGGQGGWPIDHCHNTNRVRGLLCTNCNVGLGHFKDNPDVLQTAITYLRKDLS